MNGHFRPSLEERVLRWMIVAALAAISFELVRRAIPMYLPRDWAGAHELDAIEDWKAAKLYFQGISPYAPQGLAAIGQSGMGHPPTTPFWFLPVAEFPKETVVQLSTFLVWVLLPVHTFLCARALSFPAPFATATVTASALFASYFVKYHCDATQFSEPIAVLYVAGWLCLRSGRDARAGVCLGLALTMKLFPGVLLLMLLFARRFRAFFAASVSYLAVALFMTETYGLRSWFDFFQQQGEISRQALGSVQNSSLSGLILQLITPACIDDGRPSTLATTLTFGCSALLLSISFWLCRRHFSAARERDARAIDLPFALFGVLSVFLNAWVWDHYAVLVVQPLFILVAEFARLGSTAFRRWCEERLTSKQLLRVAGALLCAAPGFWLTFDALTVDSHQREDMLNLWKAHHLPFYHRLFHWLQIENFAVWIAPILLCFWALRLSPPRRQNSTAS